MRARAGALLVCQPFLLLTLLSTLPTKVGSAEVGEADSSAAGGAEVAGAPVVRPSFVFILADDLGWGDVGYHGSEIETPRIDALARNGVRLDQHYAQPVCTASRAALLTGRYPLRYGLQAGAIKGWSTFGLPSDEPTLAESLRDAGYATALVGKWHLGHAAPEMLPRRRGFDRQYGLYTDAIDYFEHTNGGGLDWHRDDLPLNEPGYSTRLIGEEARRIILEHDPARPLFLLVAFNAPHTPLQAPEEELAKVSGLMGRRRTYAAMVGALDTEVGRIVDAVAESGLRDRTLVVFTSDNGASPLHGGSNGALRSGKATLYEGGIRVPTVVCWPDRLEGGRVVRAPTHLVDWRPTLLRLAAAEVPRPDRELDGVDIVPFLAGETATDREILHNIGYTASAIRVGRWKLITRPAGDRGVDGGVDGAEATTELYDIAADPEEQHDVAARQPAVVARLMARMRVYAAEAVPAATLTGASRRRPKGFRAPEVWGAFPQAGTDGSPTTGSR